MLITSGRGNGRSGQDQALLKIAGIGGQVTVFNLVKGLRRTLGTFMLNLGWGLCRTLGEILPNFGKVYVEPWLRSMKEVEASGRWTTTGLKGTLKGSPYKGYTIYRAKAIIPHKGYTYIHSGIPRTLEIKSQGGGIYTLRWSLENLSMVKN